MSLLTIIAILANILVLCAGFMYLVGLALLREDRRSELPSRRLNTLGLGDGGLRPWRKKKE